MTTWACATDLDLSNAFASAVSGDIVELTVARQYTSTLSSKTWSPHVTLRPHAGITTASVGTAVSNTWTDVSGVTLSDVTFAAGFNFKRCTNMNFTGTRTDTVDGVPVGCDSTGTIKFVGACSTVQMDSPLFHDTGNNQRGLSINCIDGATHTHASAINITNGTWRDLGGDGAFVVGLDNSTWVGGRMHDLSYTPVRTATLNATISNGQTKTALTVTASHPAYPSGQQLQLGATGQFVTTSAAVAVNATNIPVTSFTANQTYSSGLFIYDDAYNQHTDGIQWVAGSHNTIRQFHIHNVQQQGMIIKYEAGVIAADMLDDFTVENTIIDHVGGQYVTPNVPTPTGYAGGDTILISTVRRLNLVHVTTDTCNAKSLMVQYRASDQAAGQTTSQMVWKAVNCSFETPVFNTTTDVTAVPPALFSHNRRAATGYGSWATSTPSRVISDATDVVTDSPGYANTTVYELLTGSALKDAGATTAAGIVLPAVDFDGNARAGTPDIGAQEFASGTITIPVGQALETDIARPIIRGIVTSVGQAHETSAAQRISVVLTAPPAATVPDLIFRPPVVYDVPRTVPGRHPGNALMRHYNPLPRGQNVYLLNDGTAVTQQPYDPQNTIIRRVFFGGHREPVTAEEAALLTDAGYGDNITST